MQASVTKNKNNLILTYILKNSVVKYIKENLGIIIGLAVMCTILSILSPAFLTKENIINVLRQVSTNANLAFGMTLAIIINGIDLSVGSILALSGTITAGLITFNNMPVITSVIIGIIIGISLGLFNGIVIAKTGIPPFIVTLAMYNIARGAAYVYTGGMPVRTMNEQFNFIGNGYLGPIPLPVIYTLIFLVTMYILMNKTKFGRYVYAVGGNRDAARFSGINIKKIEIAVYTIIGFLSGFSGIVLCARMYSGQPTVGVGFELDAIAACVLGGTSMMGGIGKIGGTVLGVLVIGVLNNGLNLLNINSFWQLIAKGVVILLAVYVDILKKKKK
ncbi:ribose ABC transporter permease [Caloramator sp. E03]|uniref:ABC transporter permease n=1 Tax=Caloramator sp. E03 TaxID=2576307 RepID=UPI0011105B97|nr:ribose ABC transporter permease [Caloramator sp. E03]QCX34395.1 ribose ABC transporter permease [Caloramator sp. E03]